MPVLKVRSLSALPVLFLLAARGFAAGQEPAAMPSGPDAAASGPPITAVIANVRPALDHVNLAVSGLRIAHWKAPQETRSATMEDVASIQRDLDATLPPLLDQAQGSTAPLAPSFSVFRNIDALYDVLLRVAEMANLAGSDAEASRLEAARASLEAARSQLGDFLLASVTAQETQIARLHAQIAAAAKAAPPAPPTRIVVDDGPEPVNRHRRKKRPTPAAKPATPPPS